MPLVFGLIEDALRAREEFLAENRLLRQQLVVASREVKQPRFRPLERGLSVLLASKLRHWREASPFGKGPQVLIRDRDANYGALLDRVTEGADIEVVLTAPCTPRMNSVAEGFLGGVR